VDKCVGAAARARAVEGRAPAEAIVPTHWPMRAARCRHAHPHVADLARPLE